MKPRRGARARPVPAPARSRRVPGALPRRRQAAPSPFPGGRAAFPRLPWTAHAATLCGLGRLPLAPGTWGSLGTVLVWMPLRTAFPGLEWPVVGLLAAVAVHAAGAEARRLGGRDPGSVVIDEAAGMVLALTALPWMPSPLLVGAAFLLFRLFDVVKPPPLRWLERLPGGWGIVADDLGAGLYTLLLLRLLTPG